MKTNEITPELVGYAKAIVRQRGIAQADMTPAIMGEVLQEAVRRMEMLCERYQNSREMQEGFAAAIYFNTPIA